MTESPREGNRGGTYSNTRGTMASRSMCLPGERVSLVPELTAVGVTVVTKVVVPGDAPGVASADVETVVDVDVG